ncbi:ficolin-2-like [Anopheles bellator]|uniref:ficolin-2-like n=1 Tax=Anopheles bellator TaxID=139047 RepID=UPI00264A4B6E|nr:ficolin-2-like [Anopheles bellator]
MSKIAVVLFLVTLNNVPILCDECKESDRKFSALTNTVGGLVKSVETLSWLAQLNGETINQINYKTKLMEHNITLVQRDIKELIAGQQSLLASQRLVLDSLTNNSRRRSYESCRQVPSNVSGVYRIEPEKPFKEPMTVLCDQEYDSGGWIVIQHRFNGSTNFYRNWKEYQNGFGQLEGEFWLGLDRIHQLTTSKPHELVILLEDFDGNKTYAKYSRFEIGGESELYALNNITGYSGTAGDSLDSVAGMKFSTLDSDNDTWVEGSCAVTYCGAWWYWSCHRSNLNGRYLRGETKEYATGMVWYSFRGYLYSLKSSKMMIRPVAQRKV